MGQSWCSCLGFSSAMCPTLVKLSPSPSKGGTQPTFGQSTATASIKDYMVSGQHHTVVVKRPGELNGMQFIVEDCQDCHIYLFDVTAQINIDSCRRCHFFIGPCEGSILVRDCEDCVVVAASHQFRTRDCVRLDAFLHCTTQPSIEASTHCSFGCFRFFYPALSDQFQAAKLPLFVNEWSHVFDFNPPKQDSDLESEEGNAPPNSNKKTNWVLFDDAQMVSFIQQRLQLPPIEVLHDIGIDPNYEVTASPYTWGRRSPPHPGETCFVAGFQATNVLLELLSQVEGLRLQAVASQSPYVSLMDTKTIFHSSAHFSSLMLILPSTTKSVALVTPESSIDVLYFMGPNSNQVVAGLIFNIRDKYPEERVYSTPEQDTAKRYCDVYFNQW